jgi:hypothetical protein
MSKDRARKRAKAKAAAKAAGTAPKAIAPGGKPEAKNHPGKFDPYGSGMKGASTNVKGSGPQRRGAARSR